MARLDSELVARGIARSRERAKEMIRSGSITVNGNIETVETRDKTSRWWCAENNIDISSWKAKIFRSLSRVTLCVFIPKLKKAIENVFRFMKAFALLVKMTV